VNWRTAPLDIGQRVQIDTNVPGMPWVAHESYETPDCTGARRVAFGATEDECRARGERNAARFPIPANVPHEAEVGG
jgi:hypothetical protein